MPLPTPSPTSPADLRDATWEDLAPLYDALAAAPITGDGTAWLTAWSQLQSMVEEAGSLAMIEYTCDTTDPAREAANLRWSSEIFPQVVEQHVRLARRLVDSGLEPPGMSMVLREFRSDIAIFREENVPLFTELEEHVAAYQKVTGGLSVEWEGASLTVPQLQPFLKVADRAVRERAFRTGARAYLDQREVLAAQFDAMFALRQQIAANAGFPDHMAWAFAAKHRFDYTPDDCAQFHEAVATTVTPVVERLMAHRAQVLGVTTVRPWDTLVQLEARDPVRPFADVDGLVAPAQRIFDRLDPELGARFREMSTHGLLDLGSRPGKAPGGYCTNLAWRKQPFIFMNAVGVPDDVNTLVHEAGHCFHDFAANQLPWLWQRSAGHEAAELASMSMELLVTPWLVQPTGYYTPEQARAVEIEQLEDVLTSLCHIASVDAFQRWIYTSGDGHDASARDQAWLRIRARFEAGVDWSGLEAERVARWYRQLHIFELPFYYIEYGIAQLGALQLWRDAQRDPAGTLARYRAFQALGGTRPLPELYAAAGARLIFDREGMAELVGLVEQRLEALRR
ncbi:MAG: M3 family oligoendopeptidase [Gemmatimonadetes bacterium]|nr:M3 family oligoendopeptidase [Gemmatimonadota bacterium]